MPAEGSSLKSDGPPEATCYLRPVRIVPGELHDLPPCPCCKRASRVVAGRVLRDHEVLAEYQVHWTDGPMHEPRVGFYLVFGGFYPGASPKDRYAVALTVDAGPGPLAIAVFDANTSPIAEDPDVGRALRAIEVAGTPLAALACEMVELAMDDDPRLVAFASGKSIARA